MELKHLATAFFIYLLLKDLILYSLSKIDNDKILSNSVLSGVHKILSAEKVNKALNYLIIAILGYYLTIY